MLGEIPYRYLFPLQVLFQIALAALDANRNKLLTVEDDGEAMTVLGHYLEGVTNRDSTVNIPSQPISNRNIGVPQATVSRRQRNLSTVANHVVW